MPRGSSWRRGAFSIIELLVVIGIIGSLMGIILPALEKAREQANNVRCATNLVQIGSALLRYSNENHGFFPRTIYVPGAPPTAGTNPAAQNPFGPGGPLPNDMTAPLFLLIRTQGVPTSLFVEPYNDEIENTPDPTTDPQSRANFTNAEANCGYSYANPYPDAAAVAKGLSPDEQHQLRFRTRSRQESRKGARSEQPQS